MKQDKINEIVSGWKLLHNTRKMIVIQEAIHPAVAEHENIELSVLRAEGCNLLRKSLPDLLSALSDDDIDSIHQKYSELK